MTVSTASDQRCLCQPLIRPMRLGGFDSRVRNLRRLLAKQCWVTVLNILRSIPGSLSTGRMEVRRELTRGEGLNECGATFASKDRKSVG